MLRNIAFFKAKGASVVICPNCHSKDLGKIGVNQYYCWGCYIELTINKGMIYTHQVEEDGTLSSLDDLFDEEDRKLSM
ncbi:hypothetical protein RAH41_04010 [Gottfriedia acidiceleris]|uniref:hypothetical protein n=1 Tax=Gottfriedia acidiceleris TaxID=371036 RepID=UPI002F260364